jgi:hypothetical protein
MDGIKFISYYSHVPKKNGWQISLCEIQKYPQTLHRARLRATQHIRHPLALRVHLVKKIRLEICPVEAITNPILRGREVGLKRVFETKTFKKMGNDKHMRLFLRLFFLN